MKQWLVAAALVSASLSTSVWADAALDQNKKAFEAKTQEFMGALTQSLAKMDKNYATLANSEKTLQGYLKQPTKPQEKQCLNAMLKRASGTKNLVATMKQQLLNAQKQMPGIKTAAMKAQSTAQLNQSADKANAIVQGLNVTGERNSQMAETWTAAVDAACKGL